MNFTSKATAANFKKDGKEVSQNKRRDARAGMQKFTKRRNARANRAKLGLSLLKHHRRRRGFLKGLCHGILPHLIMLKYVFISMETRK